MILTWWGFAMSAVLLAPTAVLVSATLPNANTTVLAVATTVGILAALVQFLGLIRWPFAVPHLARTAADPAASTGTKEAIDVTFQTLNRYLGVAVGEHLGYLFTGAWTGLVGLAVIQSDVLHTAFGVGGLVLAPLFVVCSFECVGSFERKGWRLAGHPRPHHVHRLVTLADGHRHCPSDGIKPRPQAPCNGSNRPALSVLGCGHTGRYRPRSAMLRMWGLGAIRQAGKCPSPLCPSRQWRPSV